MNQSIAAKDACGPCLTNKEIKKRQEQEVKDLKATINFLVKIHGYEHDASAVVGKLVARLIYAQGPLK